MSLTRRRRQRGSAPTDDSSTPAAPDPGLIDDAFVDILSAEDKNHRYDLQTAAIIRRVVGPDDLAVDVGAHSGEILTRLVEAAPGVRHLAVEPIPELAAGLRSRFPGVDVHELALVDVPSGPISFHHVTSNPGYSGILKRRFDRPHEDVDVIEVPTARLDDLVGDRCVSLIKVDVEGAELGVLQGASTILGRDRPVVVFEHGLGATDVYGTTPEAVFDIFAGHDMGVHLLASWLEFGPPLNREQFAAQFHEGRNYYFVASP